MWKWFLFRVLFLIRVISCAFVVPDSRRKAKPRTHTKLHEQRKTTNYREEHGNKIGIGLRDDLLDNCLLRSRKSVWELVNSKPTKAYDLTALHPRFTIRSGCE